MATEPTEPASEAACNQYKEPIKVMAWSPPMLGWHNMNHKSQYANQPRAMATSPYIVMACMTWWHNRRHKKRRPI
jgi:hypothetical protein